MKYILSILIALLLVAVVRVATFSQERRWLSYEPAIVELEGRLVTEMKYGPPNFGERPKTDQKVNVPILLLAHPINVRGTPGDAHNAQSVAGAKRIQLVFLDGSTEYKKFIGKNVVVKGTLFHAATGHHYTDVLITVSSLGAQPVRAQANSDDKRDPCPNAMSQAEINRCAGDYFKKSDAALNKVYKRILNRLSGSDRTNLIEAQRAWVKYRSANCWAQREHKFSGGSLAPTEEAFCLRDVTEARTNELIKIYETEEDK